MDEEAYNKLRAMMPPHIQCDFDRIAIDEELQRAAKTSALNATATATASADFQESCSHAECTTSLPPSASCVLWRGPDETRFTYYSRDQWIKVAVHFLDANTVRSVCTLLATGEYQRRAVCVFCWAFYHAMDDDHSYRQSLPPLSLSPPDEEEKEDTERRLEEDIVADSFAIRHNQVRILQWTIVLPWTCCTMENG
jgi:hypothetical protein